MRLVLVLAPLLLVTLASLLWVTPAFAAVQGPPAPGVSRAVDSVDSGDADVPESPRPGTDAPAEGPVPPDGAEIGARILRRVRLAKAHKAAGKLTLVAVFTAEGFGLANRIALATGTPRGDLSPTLNLHRGFVLTSTIAYITTGSLGLAMPGLTGTRGSKFKGGLRLPSNRHAALAVGHMISMLTAGVTGILQAHVLDGTPAYEPLLVAHHIAAGTTSAFMVAAVVVVH